MSAEPQASLKPDTINRHFNSVYPALAVMAGMQLEVFTAIGERGGTAEELAAAMSVHAGKLRALLYALVTAGLLEVDEGVFRNTAEAREFLIKGRPRYIGSMHAAYSDLWASTMYTAESIRSGIPQAKHDFSTMSQGELSQFIRGLDAGAGASARRLHKEYDMRRFGHVLDAGGGSGGVAIALAGLCPALRATIAELPNVAGVSRECVAESEHRERLDVVEADLVAAPPPGQYDAAVMRSVLQVLSASDAAACVKHVAAALKPGAELFVLGRMLDNDRLSPLDAVAVNVMFLNVYDDGQAYTEAEYREWFSAAGFSAIERRPISGGYSIMRGCLHPGSAA